MDLFLVRHARAVAPAKGTPDAARRLTQRGRAQTRRLRRVLRRVGIRFDRLVHSPLLRALETADGLASLLDGESLVTQRLNGRPTEELLADLQGTCVAVVGHEPYLASLAAWLIGKTTDGVSSFRLPPAGFSWLTGDPRPGGMRLHALLPPRVQRALVRR